MRGMYKDMVKYIKCGDMLKDHESKRKGNIVRYTNSLLSGVFFEILLVLFFSCDLSPSNNLSNENLYICCILISFGKGIINVGQNVAFPLKFM